jgi:hypothetical protein
LLTSISGAASAGSVNFENINVAGESGNVVPSVGGSLPGLLDISNTNPDGSTVAGADNVSLGVPVGYSTLFVQSPGSETIAGNNSSNFLAIFTNNTSVTFNSSGSGTVVAAGAGDQVNVSGQSWSVYGSLNGGDSINSFAANSTFDLNGNASTPGNLIGVNALGDTVASNGNGDIIEFFDNSSGVVSMSGENGNVLVNGGNVTVDAVNGGTNNAAFFNTNGGALDFINSSSVSASVFGATNGAVGGSLTVFGGAGGGYYQGGPGGGGNAGPNSLVGGTGFVTLIGAGASSYLATGVTTGSGSNDLVALGTGGSTTMIGAVGSVNNQFQGSNGSLMVSTSGSGSQVFFVGASGEELLHGSTIAGSTNNYFFDQASTDGSGVDYIYNFRVGVDALQINPFAQATPGGAFNPAAGGVSIQSEAAFGNATVGSTTGGVELNLSNGTLIRLYGVTQAQYNADTNSSAYRV